MEIDKLSKYLIKPELSLEHAISSMIKFGLKTLVICRKKKILGTLSDGDIRKLIIKKINLSDKVIKYANKKPKVVKENISKNKIKKLFLDNNYDLIPVVDNNNNLAHILSWNEFFGDNKSNLLIQDVPLIIMAGGLGSRLYPFTSILPKPLMPYNDKTLIENVIDSFSTYGLKKIIITINFKSKIIKAYFKEIYKKEKKISLIKENKKLGTCGPLKNLKTKSKQIFITNCDSLLTIDYNDLLTFHIKNKNSLTIVSANIKSQIPYGICNLSNVGKLKSFDEKPIFHYLANVGFYVLNTSVIKLIPKNKYYDMNEFIQLLIKKKFKVAAFPIDPKQWVDAGQNSMISSRNA